MNTEWILKAVETIKSGIADKLTKDNITIYRVKNIIRIDIKEWHRMTANEMTDNEIIKFIEHAINSAKGEDGFKEIYW